MRRSSIVFIVAGIVFGVIIIFWQLVPLLTVPPLKVTWTAEATDYKTNWAPKVFLAAGVPGQQVVNVVGTASDNAEKLANHTDFVVHLIDMRIGMALTWWGQSQAGGDYPGRYSWNPLNRTNPPLTAWERLTETEKEVGVPLPSKWVDWDYDAVNYLWNPGDPYYDLPDQPDYMMKVLQAASGTNATEFRDMFANATVEAEVLVNATDKVVSLDDLKEAIAQILFEWDKYATVDEARAAIATLEQDP